MQIKIPFQGFYNTRHEGELEGAVEYVAEDFHGYILHPKPTSYELIDEVQDAIDWRNLHKAYAKEYATLFFHKIKEELGIDVTPTEVEISSPREYNYSNDTILAQITEEDWLKLYKKVDRHNLKCEVAEELAPRSGFIPFYSNDIEDWGEPWLWEAPQIELALQVLMEQNDVDFEQSIVEEIDTYSLIDGNIDWDKLNELYETNL